MGWGSGLQRWRGLPLGPEPVHAAACMSRACRVYGVCMPRAWRVHATYTTRAHILCICGAYMVHKAHIAKAPRLSKAREVRHRWRRARHRARRRACRRARRRAERHMPRIVRGAAVAWQRAELGRHRSELRVRACEGRAAVARVPVPLRRPVQCGVSSTTVCVHCAHAPRTHRARTTAHAPHVCCGYTCSSSTAAGLYSRQFSRHSLSHIGLQPLTYRVAGLYSR